jgi:hypothetical protein
MITRIARITVAGALAAALIVPSPFAFACGPDFSGPVFTEITGPEIPEAEYAAGRLELLQHSYWHQPLYIAYRNLSGKLFAPAEMKIFTEPSAEQTAAAKDWIQIWKDTRANLLGKTPDAPLYNSEYGIAREINGSEIYLEYYNCLNNAFENAVQTLNKRAKQFGAQNPIVKDWIAAQDQVFENCSGGPGFPPKPKPAVIPAVAHPDDPDVVRADRAYQIAAAHFYAGEYVLAQSSFEAIAKDPVSPYRHLAPYLVARALIRRGTLDTGDDQYDSQALAQAELQLHGILADKNLEDMHEPAQRLLGFVSIRLHRQQRFGELETTLSTGGDRKTFRQDLTDYLWLLDHPMLSRQVTLPIESPGEPPRKAALPNETTRLTGGDMTEWILTFQQTGDAAAQHSVQRWQQTKSLPWLVAAISKVSANDSAAANLSAAAEKIPSDSPAYITVTFHRLRLLQQSGKSDRAREQLDQLLAQRGSTLSRSAKNQFAALRMKIATNLRDFLRFAPRVSNDSATYPNSPSGAGATSPSAENASHFDADASVILTEKLPLRLLADAAKSPTLPIASRREVVIAAWTRGTLLNNEAIAQELVPTLEELVPEIKADLAAYATASDSPSRQFAAVFAMLRNPGFRPLVTAGYARGNLYTIGEPRFDRIDNLHDNWWCSSAPAAEDQFFGQDYYHLFSRLSSPLQEIYPGGKVDDPAFLTPDDRATAAKEQAELAAQPAAPNWLGKQALDWATNYPDDPRVPEALHLVVRARRYGCANSSPENYSKLAFTLLHKRYPDSQWTKQTPYWFP